MKFVIASCPNKPGKFFETLKTAFGFGTFWKDLNLPSTEVFPTGETARAEAANLARQYSNQTFVILQVVGTVRASEAPILYEDVN